MKPKQLDFIYDHWHHRLGWLSWLEENFSLSIEDVQYLTQRAEQDEWVNSKIHEWEDEIERAGGYAIYNENDIGKKLVLINSRINEIEKESESFMLWERELFLDLSPLESLCGARYRIRNQLLNREVPDRKEVITDAEIDRARNVPLSDFVKAPKTHKILCPFHKEKSPSFHVGKWGYCYGCGKHIDSIGWVMGQLGKSFTEAVKWLGGIGI